MARGSMAWWRGLTALAMTASLAMWPSGGSAQSPGTPDAVAPVLEPLAWTSDRPRLRDDERWLDLAKAPSGVLVIGRDDTGPIMARRAAGSGWRSIPFPPFRDGAAAGSTDGPTRVVVVDDRALAVGTVAGRLAAWSPGPSETWRRAPGRPVMALPPVGDGVDAGMATVGWVASDGDRVMVTGSAACRECATSTWASDDGRRWTRSHVAVDGAELVAVFSGQGRILGVAVGRQADGIDGGTLVAAAGDGRWTAIAPLPIPWLDDVQIAETSEALVVVGLDDAGRSGTWSVPPEGGTWRRVWSEPVGEADEITVSDVAVLGPSVLAVGAIEGDGAAVGWSLWSPDGLDWSVATGDPGAGCPTSAILTAESALAVGDSCDGDQIAWRATLPGPVRCNGLAPTIEADANGGEILGTPGDDVILGSAAEDRIDGGDGNDVICGGGEHDVLLGGSGDDVLLGEADADELTPGPGDDMVDGGADRYDSVSYRDAPGGIRADLAVGRVTGEGTDEVRNVEYLTATRHRDRIVAGADTAAVDGLAGDDVLIGSSGPEALQGGAGRDRIDGRGGRDFIEGGAGQDVLRGGPGADTVVGGESVDDIRGGRGRDLLFGATTHDCAEDCSFPFLTLADRLDGGPGNDTCLDGRRFRCEVDR